jgi:uncharacterized protein (DUF433 family)
MDEGGVMVDPAVGLGKPVIASPRVLVEVVLDALGGGMTYREVMAKYDLTREDILTALDYVP